MGIVSDGQAFEPTKHSKIFLNLQPEQEPERYLEPSPSPNPSEVSISAAIPPEAILSEAKPPAPDPKEQPNAAKVVQLPSSSEPSPDLIRTEAPNGAEAVQLQYSSDPSPEPTPSELPYDAEAFPLPPASDPSPEPTPSELPYDAEAFPLPPSSDPSPEPTPSEVPYDAEAAQLPPSSDLSPEPTPAELPYDAEAFPLPPSSDPSPEATPSELPYDAEAFLLPPSSDPSPEPTPAEVPYDAEAAQLPPSSDLSPEPTPAELPYDAEAVLLPPSSDPSPEPTPAELPYDAEAVELLSPSESLPVLTPIESPKGAEPVELPSLSQPSGEAHTIDVDERIASIGKPKNPGYFDDLFQQFNDLKPDTFDGVKLMWKKCRSKQLQITHNFHIGNQGSDAGYRVSYLWNRTNGMTGFFPSLLGEINSNGCLSAGIIQQFSENLRFKLSSRFEDFKLSSDIRADYFGSDFTASLSVTNPNIFAGSGMLVAQYLQTVNERLVAGAELSMNYGPIEPGCLMSNLSLAGSYTVGNTSWSIMAAMAGVHIGYYQRFSKDLQYGIELKSEMQQSLMTFCYKYNMTKADMIFRGSIDTNMNVCGVLEKRLRPLPFSFLLSGHINHALDKFRLGFGVIMD